MLSALVFWDKTNVNSSIVDTTDSNIETISKKVNGGKHGLEQRIKITKNMFKQLSDE